MNTKDFHVLVIGAGPTGLMIAQGLRKHGISCRVYERSDAETYRGRQRDWSMALHWGAEFLRTCLPPDLLGEVRRPQPDPGVVLTHEQETGMPVVNGETGEVVFCAAAASVRRVSREKLRALLARGVEVECAKRLTGVEVEVEDGKVVARFEDGSCAVGDVLVGCDSASSVVREYLLGLERAACETLPIVTYNFTCKYTAEQALFIRNAFHPLQKNAIHPTEKTWYVLPIMDVEDPTKPETWVFQHFFNKWIDDGDATKTPETSAGRLAHFKLIAGKNCEPWHSASHWVPDDTFVPEDRIKHWPKPSRWDNHGGRVTLAGDAAHPMVPYRGQGLNNGLQDAARYVETLKRVLEEAKNGIQLGSCLKRAIDQYDEEVCTRGSQEIALSAEQGYRTMHFDDFMSSPLVKFGLNKASEASKDWSLCVDETDVVLGEA